MADVTIRMRPNGPLVVEGVVTVVGDDLFQVLGSQRLCVVTEDLLGASRRCHGPPPSYRRGQPDVSISTEDKARHKGVIPRGRCRTGIPDQAIGSAP